MPVNIRAYKGRPVPYYEFSDSQLRYSIEEAEASIRRLVIIDHPRSVWAIKVLKENIRVMRRVMGGAS